MSMLQREFLYSAETLNNNRELDYLSRDYKDLNLRTIEYYMVTAATEYRPDLISLLYLGNYHLGWLIALHNDFLDPIYDFRIGTRIKIPNLKEYYQFFSRNSRKD